MLIDEQKGKIVIIKGFNIDSENMLTKFLDNIIETIRKDKLGSMGQITLKRRNNDLARRYWSRVS
jgi:hypothetical protein